MDAHLSLKCTPLYHWSGERKGGSRTPTRDRCVSVLLNDSRALHSPVGCGRSEHDSQAVFSAKESAAGSGKARPATAPPRSLQCLGNSALRSCLRCCLRLIGKPKRCAPCLDIRNHRELRKSESHRFPTSASGFTGCNRCSRSMDNLLHQSYQRN